jgi:hypothetical protein
VNPGNSGGPIIDEQGRVAGVVTLKQDAGGRDRPGPAHQLRVQPGAGLREPAQPRRRLLAVFQQMMADASANGGMQLPATQGVAIDVLPLLAAVDYDQYRRLVVRVLRVQDTTPGYYEATIKVWSSTEPICTLKGDVASWKEVDPDQAGSGVSDEMLRALKRLGAVHIFMGEAALATQPCAPIACTTSSWSSWAATRSRTACTCIGTEPKRSAVRSRAVL